MLRRYVRYALFAAISGVFVARAAAAENTPWPGPPPVVFVADFELDANNVAPDSGPGQRVRRLRGLLPANPGLPGRDPGRDPQTRAKEIVDEMASALTADLQKAGIDARRAASGESLPATGWQVRGVFLNVDEGNRVRRAIVGFGAGDDSIQVAVSCDSLAQANLQPLYQSVDNESGGGAKPGAIIRLNPYVIAAKFVMSRGDEKKTIEKTAQNIADAVIAKLRGAAR